MRIVYVGARLPFAGNEHVFIPEIKEYLRQGHDILLVPRNPPSRSIDKAAEDLLARTVAQPLLSPKIFLALVAESVSSPVRVFKTLALLFRSRNLITLIKNLAVFPKGVWLSRLAKEWKADHIHVQWAASTATMGMVASELSGISWSFTAHRGDIYLNNLLNVKSKKAKFVRFIAEDGVKIAQELSDFSIEKAHVIHMGVNIAQNDDIPAEFSDVAPTDGGAPVVLCPANMEQRKGHAYLLEAIKILKDRGVRCRLALSGQGMDIGSSPIGALEPNFRKARPSNIQSYSETAAEILEKIKKYSLEDDTVFLGFMPYEALLNLYRKRLISVVALPTLHEGIPMALIEPMGHGIPVVSTPVGGIPELLQDGAGLMVPIRDPVALADAIGMLLTDGDAWKRYSKEGRKRVEDSFAVENNVSRIAGLMR